ncbi:terminase small subunit [Rhodobacter phage RcMotherGoose]|nr:terminase small subunit [Rhodobacter phage RcMotherGoose]
MNVTPFKADELPAAKQAFAEAFLAERARSPFKPDPFRAALTVWNEDNGQLPRALWVAHAARWHDDPEVLEYVATVDAEAEAERQAEKIVEASAMQTEDFKALVKFEGIQAMRDIMKNATVESKDRIAAFDRLSKSLNLDEKPVVDDTAGRILGVIQHELKPVDAAGVVVPFDDRVRNQQRALQTQVAAFEIELEGGDNARLVN